MDEHYDLGAHRRPVSTSSVAAQRWFDRGLVWLYAYNHEAAIDAFERALAEDATCVMALWGIGYALGPNYNKPWDTFTFDEKRHSVGRSQEVITAAMSSGAEATAVERALVEALAQRCPARADIEDFAPFNDAFADAMRDVCDANPEDLDVLAFAVEAMMNRHPWQLWDLASGEPTPDANTLEAKGRLEAAFASRPDAWSHPGLLHFFIHLMEMSPTPELALRHGDRLHRLVPDAGHLIHMATHIDMLCGDYAAVVERNDAAIAADRKYLAKEGGDNFYTLYRCHNLHFKAHGAMFLAQPTAALEAAAELRTNLPESVLRPYADWLEAFVPIDQHVLVRFGRWEEILAQALPEDPDLYRQTTAMIRYARTVALANTGRIAEAERERDRFLEALERVPQSRMLFNATAREILEVGRETMLGELAYHAGDVETGLDHLRRAVALDDALPYDEPWGWMHPTRHALGALLLAQNRFDEAEAVYRADLGLDGALSRAVQHPQNVWSLHGLHECLERRGETAEILHVRQQLARAQARAEVPVRSSCYCRPAA